VLRVSLSQGGASHGRAPWTGYDPMQAKGLPVCPPVVPKDRVDAPRFRSGAGGIVLGFRSGGDGFPVERRDLSVVLCRGGTWCGMEGGGSRVTRLKELGRLLRCLCLEAVTGSSLYWWKIACWRGVLLDRRRGRRRGGRGRRRRRRRQCGRRLRDSWLYGRLLCGNWLWRIDELGWGRRLCGVRRRRCGVGHVMERKHISCRE
jgi:hypothetical protein